MHPLNPRVRWLILPALSMAFAWILCFGTALVLRSGSPGAFSLMGVVLAGAAALATALSSKLWVGYLAAPPLGNLGVVAVLIASGLTDSQEILRVLLDAKNLFMSALLTAPVVVLHGIRMRRPASWSLKGLALYAIGGVATAFAHSLMRGSWEVGDWLFYMAIFLANGAALEVALRVNGAEG